MTRDEAITIMQVYKEELEHRIAKIDYDVGAIDLYSIQVEAYDMAIEALSAEAPKPSVDMISRADAIEAVRKEYEDAVNIGDNGDAVAYDVERILSALPSAEAEQGWIPCSERLPSESGWYLITVQGYETVADMDWYYTSWGAWNGVSSEQQVIAWMPLPTPYKGGDSE